MCTEPTLYRPGAPLDQLVGYQFGRRVGWSLPRLSAIPNKHVGSTFPPPSGRRSLIRLDPPSQGPGGHVRVAKQALTWPDSQPDIVQSLLGGEKCSTTG